MNRMLLTDDNSEFFNEAFTIYESSFPKKERRSREMQITILEDKSYRCEVIEHEGKCVGILFWWLIDNYRFIEHFAITPTLRNTGIGKNIISNFLEESEIPVVLEVEKPENPITIRRIKFYERLGFHFSNSNYSQPPFILGNPFVDLRLMSFPFALSENDVCEFSAKTHPIVHKSFYMGNSSKNSK